MAKGEAAMLRCSGFILSACLAAAIFVSLPARGVFAQESVNARQSGPAGPSDAKARKTFNSAIAWQHQGARAIALDTFLKASKQDGGHCAECLKRAYDLAMGLGDYAKAEEASRDGLPLVASDAQRAELHFDLAMALQDEGVAGKKDKCFSASCDEFKSALALDPSAAAAHYGMGVSLAHLHQDDAARAEFTDFAKDDKSDADLRQRAALYARNPDLARARMAPPFAVTTLDGRQISLDGLEGKVVLIDFWATWCGPCREALPHIREIARRFEGQPLVVLSVSLDDDEKKWRDFVAKNGMTWLQYRDGGFNGRLATLFGVRAIPATFTIDADGVLEDQHVGDADIEGKLKKLIARAVEAQNEKAAPAAAQKTAGAGS
ncbi:MAG TPA: redoxin domain-containing protein [Terracidiphilus sp.]|nr:redoxin domain-containing protein [Terracidiphilus sp.]